MPGRQGRRGKDFNMRWIAPMVYDAPHPDARGGIFMYPGTSASPTSPGKLRLMYEANPMGWLSR